MGNNLPLLATSGKHHILCVDPSGSHLAYAYAELDLDLKELFIVEAGMVWTKNKFERGERLKFMEMCLDQLIHRNYNPPNIVITEAFFMSPGMLTGGTAIIPTINALMQMAISQDARIKYQEIGPSTWRGILGIKPVKDAKGKRDYKQPTKDFIEKYLGKMPEEISSNIDMKKRKLPNDITDVLAIAFSVGKHHECKVVLNHIWDNAFSTTLALNQLARHWEG